MPNARYFILLLIMTLLFGFSFIASKNALMGLGIFQLIFGRYFFALLIFVFLFWKRREVYFIDRKDWKDLLLLTLIEPVGYFIFETFGIRFTTPSSVSLIIATIPVFSMIFSAWILKEKTSFVGILGIMISICGIYLIFSWQRQSFLAPNPLLGNFLTLGAALSAGLYNVFCRKLTRKYSPISITFYQTVVATLFFFPAALIETIRRKNVIPDPFIFLNVLYLAVGCSVIAYFILNHSLSRLQASQVAIFSNLIPVVTIAASWLFYRELLNLPQLLGAALVISGTYLTFFHAPRTPLTSPE